MKIKLKASDEPLETKVTYINGKYHCRLILRESGKVHDEQICDSRIEIGQTVQSMLRWYDKLGFQPFSRMAIASRHRSALKPQRMCYGG